MSCQTVRREKDCSAIKREKNRKVEREKVRKSLFHREKERERQKENYREKEKKSWRKIRLILIFLYSGGSKGRHIQFKMYKNHSASRILLMPTKTSAPSTLYV